MKPVHFVLVLFTVAACVSQTDAQWVQTNGPYGGSVLCFAVSGTNLFAGTSGSGVFLSTNSGTSWTAVNSGLTNTYVWALAVSGANLFAGTDDGGVFLSTNNGVNWEAVNTPFQGFWEMVETGTSLFAGTVSVLCAFDALADGSPDCVWRYHCGSRASPSEQQATRPAVLEIRSSRSGYPEDRLLQGVVHSSIRT